MTVLRQRHKNMILAGSIGFLLALVLLIIVYIIGIRNNPQFIRWILQEEQLQVEKTKEEAEIPKPILVEAYVFKGGLRENDIIKEEDVSVTLIDQDLLPDQTIHDSKEIIGKKIKCDSTPKMIATKTMVYEEKTRAEIKESVEMLGVSVPEFINESDRINLRIHYPTGQDFLVLEDVTISKIYEERKGGTLELNHDEIVCLSSAKEDINMYPGTQIYYTKDTHRYSRPFIGQPLRNMYPVNPNTIAFLTSKYKGQDVYEERLELDESLIIFFDQESEAYSFAQIEEIINEEEVNQEEVIQEEKTQNTNVEETKIEEAKIEEANIENVTTQTIGF
jgi:hypothetical protein